MVHDLTLAAAIADEVVVMSDGAHRRVGRAARDAHAASRLAEVWGVEASLEVSDDDRTALHVAWLEGEDRKVRDVESDAGHNADDA